MSPNLTLLLLLLKVAGTIIAGKYVYVPTALNWTDAQMHCRTHYTDLAPINSEYDQSLIQKLAPILGMFTWIGLMNTTNSSTGWRWSGGGEVFTFFWVPGEPNDPLNQEEFGGIFDQYNYLWVDAPGFWHLASICYKVHAIRKKMTWEDALHYCRENHQDLASVASETEMMLIKKELSKELSTNNVWIGLHFLAGEWLWVDGQPFRYESWGPFEKSTCPEIDLSCGALRLDGEIHNVGNKEWVITKQVLGWNARNCNKKRHFLCY